MHSGDSGRSRSTTWVSGNFRSVKDVPEGLKCFLKGSRCVTDDFRGLRGVKTNFKG